MSDYTPTTEEVRENYARSRFWPAAQDPARAAAFDRWLAAHDAEVRAAALAEQGVEWEYGTALRSPDGTVWDEFWHETREDAEQEIAADDESEHEGDGIVLIRRTRAIPAGPVEVRKAVTWLAVPADETEGAGA